MLTSNLFYGRVMSHPELSNCPMELSLQDMPRVNAIQCPILSVSDEKGLFAFAVFFCFEGQPSSNPPCRITIEKWRYAPDADFDEDDEARHNLGQKAARIVNEVMSQINTEYQAKFEKEIPFLWWEIEDLSHHTVLELMNYFPDDPRWDEIVWG